MAVEKVTFFDNTHFTLGEQTTEGCKDFVSTNADTTLADSGIYFTPKYKENDINTNVHHIAHNGHIYTLGSDVIENSNSEFKVGENEDTNAISLIKSVSADRFEKTIKYDIVNINFSKILERLEALETTVNTLRYGVEPMIEPGELPSVVLYYIKYGEDGNPTIVNDNDVEHPIHTEILHEDASNVNKILLKQIDFEQYIKDAQSDNPNYIYTLKHNNGDDIVIDSNDDRYDVIGIGLRGFKITNICLADENNNKYGIQINVKDNKIMDLIQANVIYGSIIKILDKQDTSIKISAIVYDKLDEQ